MKLYKNNKAFYLIELIIGIVFISILSLMIFIYSFKIKESSKKLVLLSDVDMLNRSVTLYKFAYGKFPDAENSKEAINILKSAPKVNKKSQIKKPNLLLGTSSNILYGENISSNIHDISWNKTKNEFFLPLGKSNITNNLLPPKASTKGGYFDLSKPSVIVQLKNTNKDKSTYVEYFLTDDLSLNENNIEDQWVRYISPIVISSSKKIIARSSLYFNHDNKFNKAHSSLMIETYNFIGKNEKLIPPIIYPKGGDVSSSGFTNIYNPKGFNITIINPNNPKYSKLFYSLDNGKNWNKYIEGELYLKSPKTVLAKVKPFCSRSNGLSLSSTSKEKYKLSNNIKNNFKNPDETAWYIINKVNPISIFKNKQDCGMICKIGDNYTYTISPGNQHSCNPLKVSCNKKGISSTSVAMWHTHGASNIKYNTEDFSYIITPDKIQSGDISISRKYKKPIYLGTPFGYFKKYDPKTNIKKTLGRVSIK